MDDFRYQVGDAVKIRSDLKDDGTDYYMQSGPAANEEASTYCNEMVDYAGKVVHISGYTWSDEYRIEEDGECYHWTDEMFAGFADNKVKFCSLL